MPHKHALYILYGIIAGVLLGVFAGWYFGPAMTGFGWFGALFLDALKMLIIPLIFAAVISGVASLGDIRKLGRLGGATILYFLVTTGIAVVIGLILVNLINPGEGVTLGGATLNNHVDSLKSASATDILHTLIQPNLVQSAVDGQLLPLIVFAILMSAALTTLGAVGEHVIAFFNGINEAMMKLVTWLMYLAPLGIFSLISNRLGVAGGGDAVWIELKAVGLYVATVVSGLGIHFVVLVLILLFVAKRPISYLFGLMRALLTAFGTASSSATLPLTMECAREEGVNPKAVRFVLPLGATVNMNGTALYEACAAMFIAQAYGIHLGMGQQVVVFVTATLAAIGAAGIPEAGLVTLLIVLKSVGLPTEGVALILAVDWFLDRFRTSVNVWGDAVGAAVVHRVLPQNLE
jgi:Na+/H+-dicarboxylate symporter